MIVVTITGIFMVINYLLIYTLGFIYISNSGSANAQPPWMFLPLGILLECWIEHVSFGLIYVMFTFPTSIFYRGVPGFATDCPCGVWCRGLNHFLVTIHNSNWINIGYIARARVIQYQFNVRWAECLLIIGRGCFSPGFSWILDSLIGLWTGIRSVGFWVPETPGFVSWPRQMFPLPGHIIINKIA